MNSIQIEKGVPIHPKRSPKDYGVMTALRSMSVGESFVCKATSRAHVCLSSKHLGIKVVTRKIEDGKVRVWRTE